MVIQEFVEVVLVILHGSMLQVVSIAECLKSLPLTLPYILLLEFGFCSLEMILVVLGQDGDFVLFETARLTYYIESFVISEFLGGDFLGDFQLE